MYKKSSAGTKKQCGMMEQYRKINKWKRKEKEQFFELEEKLSRISEKQNETAREITQQAQDDKMAQKSSENPEKEAPEKLIDAVLTEVFS